MPQCTLINAIASFKKSLARLKAYSSVASLARRQTCRCCSGTTNNVSSTSLVNLMNASVHAHQCNCVIQKVACRAQCLFIRGKSCKTSNMQVFQAGSDNILPCAWTIIIYHHEPLFLLGMNHSKSCNIRVLMLVHCDKLSQVPQSFLWLRFTYQDSCEKKSPKPTTIWKKHLKTQKFPEIILI